ncbi:MAG: class II aldolase/adducin family protein, partial [Alphaproteobacteria bacterium]
MKHLDLRQEIIRACLWVNEKKLNHGTSGNIGVRAGEGFLLTPSGMDYEDIEPEDIVE